jgi:FtsH Extracellular
MGNSQPNLKIDPQQQKGSPQQPGRPISSWGEFINWLVTMIFFSVWYIAVLRPKAHPAVNIPYTAFLAQVQSGNVAHVRIVRDEITGSFAKPIPSPESKEDTTASAPSNPKASPATKPPFAQSGPAAPSTYSEFQTTFPSAIGTQTLYPYSKPIKLPLMSRDHPVLFY